MIRSPGSITKAVKTRVDQAVSSLRRLQNREPFGQLSSGPKIAVIVLSEIVRRVGGVRGWQWSSWWDFFMARY